MKSKLAAKGLDSLARKPVRVILLLARAWERDEKTGSGYRSRKCVKFTAVSRPFANASW